MTQAAGIRLVLASLRAILAAGILAPFALAMAPPGPYDGETFRGRIAWSCDGNHNDEDDWAASPVALAIFALAGVKDRLVHFHYNNILPNTNPAWEKEHELSISGAIERYGYSRSIFYDCRRDLDGAVAALIHAINQSSPSNPLYLILAGPMEVPFLAIQKSDPAKRKYVYCISHSRWNDGFARGYRFPYNKRAVIPTGIRWIQIADQNKGLSTGPFGRPHTPEEWAPWLWMRDSKGDNVRFLWERMWATKRADCSDAGMAYFLVTGDEAASIDKLREMLEHGVRPQRVRWRPWVRLEAENFLGLENFELEDSHPEASHRLNLKLVSGARTGRIWVPFHEPFTPERARYDVEVRYLQTSGPACEFTLLVNGSPRGTSWHAACTGSWAAQSLPSIQLKTEDRLEIRTQCQPGGEPRLDYVHLTLKR
ncbi:MAG: hypothetical protein NZV14_05215 [Bryobacteraceae bacterium]|nr:hypothetical protein [Bryobacteraceae bacterium]MDW8377536.1 hypothetical protein [Bryobacterales bacterium]